MDTIVKADKNYRRKLLKFYGILSLITLVFITITVPLAYSHHQTLRGVQAIRFVESLEALFLISIIFPALFLIRLGIKVVKAKEYPLQSMKLIRDTSLLSGKKAVKIGRQFIILGTVSILLITLSLVANRTINDRFIDNPFSFVPAHLWEEFRK